MTGEVVQFDDSLHEGYVYTDPEGKIEVDFSDVPEPGDVTVEMKWHTDHLAYRNVTLEGDNGWTKEKVLDAIQEGHADAFRINRFRFPPAEWGEWITEHFPMLFDDRGFGERVANRTLQGFNREPRS
jgi:hypothetical protein